MQKQRIHNLLLFLALIFGSGAAAHPLAEPQANGVLVTHPLHLLQCKSFKQVGLVGVGEPRVKGVIWIFDPANTTLPFTHTPFPRMR